MIRTALIVAWLTVAGPADAFQRVPDGGAVIAAPITIMTTPSSNTGAVARDAALIVHFSSTVIVQSGWYVIDCAHSGMHAARVSGAASRYTIRPQTPFDLLESCDLKIRGDRIAAADGGGAAVADVVVHFGISGVEGDYYAGADTSSGAALKTWLHNRIKDHTAYPYTADTTDTWDILNAADQDPNDAMHILDIYKNASYVKMSGGTGNYNREHTWPNSLGFSNNPGSSATNPPYTDTHMLYLSDVSYNGSRGNKPLTNCPSGCTQLTTLANAGFGGGSGHGDSNWYQTPDGNTGSFEIWDHRKGDIARAVMYMAVRYKGGTNSVGIHEPNLELTDTRGLIVGINAQPTGGTAYMGLQSTLLAWNDLDPPDDRERLRDEVVFSYQHNRNPFVDHPEWARCVFENVPCPQADDEIFQSDFD
ncbi:MAG: endonuclease [Dokdonella sp.]